MRWRAGIGKGLRSGLPGSAHMFQKCLAAEQDMLWAVLAKADGLEIRAPKRWVAVATRLLICAAGAVVGYLTFDVLGNVMSLVRAGSIAPWHPCMGLRYFSSSLSPPLTTFSYARIGISRWMQRLHKLSEGVVARVC